jgi:hypothetical protein
MWDAVMPVSFSVLGKLLVLLKYAVHLSRYLCFYYTGVLVMTHRERGRAAEPVFVLILLMTF